MPDHTAFSSLYNFRYISAFVLCFLAMRPVGFYVNDSFRHLHPSGYASHRVSRWDVCIWIRSAQQDPFPKYLLSTYTRGKALSCASGQAGRQSACPLGIYIWVITMAPHSTGRGKEGFSP